MHKSQNTLLITIGALFCLLLFSMQARAQFLNMGLNHDSVSADILAQTYREDLWGQLGAYHHEEQGQRLQAGFLLSEPYWALSNNYWIGIGGQAVYLEAEEADGVAMAVGGMVSVALLPGLGLKAQISGFYAPAVIAFSGLDEYYDLQGRLILELLTNASVYVGHRKIHAGYEFIRNRTLDDATYVGAILRF
jgi:hypothetical protein